MHLSILMLLIDKAVVVVVATHTYSSEAACQAANAMLLQSYTTAYWYIYIYIYISVNQSVPTYLRINLAWYKMLVMRYIVWHSKFGGSIVDFVYLFSLMNPKNK